MAPKAKRLAATKPLPQKKKAIRKAVRKPAPPLTKKRATSPDAPSRQPSPMLDYTESEAEQEEEDSYPSYHRPPTNYEQDRHIAVNLNARLMELEEASSDTSEEDRQQASVAQSKLGFAPDATHHSGRSYAADLVGAPHGQGPSPHLVDFILQYYNVTVRRVTAVEAENKVTFTFTPRTSLLK